MKTLNGGSSEKLLGRFPKIDRVIFSKPATIVFWDDGVKTVATCNPKDKFRKKKGIKTCIAKRMFGNNFAAMDKAINDALKNAETEPKKFDWEGFREGTFVVNCCTEADAKEFCQAMHDHGMRWLNGSRYIDYSNYQHYRSSTCYEGTSQYSSTDYYIKNHIPIVKFAHGKFDLR
ncbi:MAG: hypothetical protein RR547_02795 [Raoultibacter sp.]